MHLDIYKTIWLKLGMMIDTAEVHSFVLVHLTLTLIQGHGFERKEHLVCQLSSEVKNGFGWNVACC